MLFEMHAADPAVDTVEGDRVGFAFQNLGPTSAGAMCTRQKAVAMIVFGERKKTKEIAHSVDSAGILRSCYYGLGNLA